MKTSKLFFAISLCFLVSMPLAVRAEEGECAKNLSESTEPSSDFAKLVKLYKSWIKKSYQVVTNQKELAEVLGQDPAWIKEALAAGKLAHTRQLNQYLRDQDPDFFQTFREKLLRVAGRKLKESLVLPEPAEYAAALGTPVDDLEAVYGKLDTVFQDLVSSESTGYAGARSYVVSKYSSAAKRVSRTPTLEEVNAEIQNDGKEVRFVFASSDQKQALFKDLADLRKLTQLLNPQLFERIVDEEKHSLAEAERVADLFVNKKRILMTTVFAGQPVHRGTLFSLLNYAKENDAALVVQPLNGVTDGLDPILFEVPNIYVMLDGMQIARWLQYDNVGIAGKRLVPLTQYMKMVKERGNTTIIAAPRLDVVTVATKDNMLRSHQLFTTGSLNPPDVYRSPHFIGQYTDWVGENLHKMGALLIEKSDGKGTFTNGETMGEFHLRQLEFIGYDKPGSKQWKPEEKGVYDATTGKLYTENGVYNYRNEALVLGDLHIAQMNKQVIDSLVALIQRVRPKRIVLHDFFDGISVSHHDAKTVMTMINKYKSGEWDLGRELSMAAAFINSILAIDPTIEIDVIKSNHDHWLYRWIATGDHFRNQTRDPNTDIAIELAHVMTNGDFAKDLNWNAIRFTKDPIEYALLNGVRNSVIDKKKGTQTIAEPSRVRFFEYGSSLKVGPEEPWRSEYQVELADHGDVAAGGKPGASPISMGTGGGPNVYGHTHIEQMRYYNGLNIGSFLPPRISYSKAGFSNWGSSVAVVSKFGHRTVFQFRNGQWFLENENSPALEPQNFYKNFRPTVLPSKNRSKPPTTAGIDQWSGNAGSSRTKRKKN